MFDSHVIVWKHHLWSIVKQDIKALELVTHTKDRDLVEELYALISKGGHVKKWRKLPKRME